MKITPKLLAAIFSCLLSSSIAWAAPPAEEIAETLKHEWEVIFYTMPSNRQAALYKEMLPKISAFKSEYPGHAEPIIMEAIIICSLAASEWSFSALDNVERARDMLIKAIALNPKAMEAAAYLTLGNLYFRLPRWPISFGDNNQARKYYEAAVLLYPDKVDTNYFLGDYWLSEGNYEKALYYLDKSNQAKINPKHEISDDHIMQEARTALELARNKNKKQASFFANLIPSFLNR